LRRFTSGQTELNPPAEELAGSDAMRRQTDRHAGFSFSCTIARSARRRSADGSTARPFLSVQSDTYGARN
jgi:hypothetical protein